MTSYLPHWDFSAGFWPWLQLIQRGQGLYRQNRKKQLGSICFDHTVHPHKSGQSFRTIEIFVLFIRVKKKWLWVWTMGLMTDIVLGPAVLKRLKIKQPIWRRPQSPKPGQVISTDSKPKHYNTLSADSQHSRWGKSLPLSILNGRYHRGSTSHQMDISQQESNLG